MQGNVFHPAIAGVSSHAISYTFTSPAGCVYSASISVVVQPIPSSQLILGGPLEFCRGDSVLLSGLQQSGVDYSWLRNGIPLPGSSSRSLVVAEGGIYRLRTAFATGCADTSAEVVVVVYDLPALTVRQPAPVCAPQAVNLSDTGLYSGNLVGIQLSYWVDSLS